MSLYDHSDNATISTDDFLLNKPCRKKELDGSKSFGFGTMQGWRRTHEDFHKYLIPLDHHAWKHWNYFAIFDGHNGSETANNAAHLFDKYLLECFNGIESKIDLHHFNHMIKHAFIHLDKTLSKIIHDDSGSVCIASLIGPKNIFLINLGDSRALIITQDGHILAATKDHKPNVRKEQERIRKAGGHITQLPNDVLRVEDQLAMTRALGDFSLDKHIIPAIPDIIQYPRDSLAAYVILASDGIWDVMNNEEVVLFVSQRVANTTLDNIISQLLDHCLQQQSTDNMTVFIVKLN